MTYEQEAKEIIEAVGGKENILQAAHCMTRLRLEIADLDIVDQKAIQKINVVKGLKINSGQLQIIIGGGVDQVCAAVQALAGEKIAVIGEKKSLSILDRVLDLVQSIFVPTVPVLVASGLLKGILVAITFSGIMDTSGTTYSLLMMISDAGFYFLPVLLAYTSAKRFNTSQVIAMALAGIMIHPTFAALGESIYFIGIPVAYVDYTSTVFPIIVGVFIMSWIEKAARKISPKILSGILVPLLTLVITAPLVLIGIGPVVNFLGLQVGNFVIWLFDGAKLVAGPVFGALYPVFVFLGIHTSLVAIELQGIAQSGYDPIIATAACANAAVAAVALYIAIKTKNKNRKSLAASSTVSGFIGITEPALYGLVAGRKEHWVAVFCGGAVGGFLVNLFGVKGYGIGPVPLAGIAVFFGDKFILYLISILITIIVTMAVLFFLGLGDEDKENPEGV